jgi:hypothetical protein
VNGKNHNDGSSRLSRRGFMYAAACAGAAATLPAGFAAHARLSQQEQQQTTPFDPDSVRTNIASALAVPRSEWSMPGRYPGVVAEVSHPKATEGCNPNHAHAEAAAALLAAGMKALTGAKDDRDAWAGLFSPEDRIGIKINPAGGKLLSNTHELTQVIIAALEAIGVPRGNITIWDHYEHMMADVGYTAENYPGIECLGFCYQAEEKGSTVWRGSDRVDESVFYEFDIPGQYDDEQWAAWMMNTGTRSYFSKLITERADKVINVPVLKNAGSFVTLCLKNLAYGSTSNCNRGHQIMQRYLSEVCAFPPVRDKVVLNIIDGLRGCFMGGPDGVARYIWDANTVWIATDPVAADSIAWDFIFEKQVRQGTAQPGELEERKAKYNYLVRAENLGLGIFKNRTIDHRREILG